MKNIVNPQQIYKVYINEDDYLTESDKQLQTYLSDNGIEILNMKTYRVEETNSVAALYVQNLGSDEDEFISYGLTENIINDFAYINTLRTPTFNETLQYKKTDLGRGDIGRKLKVNNIDSTILHVHTIKPFDKEKMTILECSKYWKLD